MAKSLHENAKRHGNDNVTCNSIVGVRDWDTMLIHGRPIIQSFTVQHTAL